MGPPPPFRATQCNQLSKAPCVRKGVETVILPTSRCGLCRSKPRWSATAQPSGASGGLRKLAIDSMQAALDPSERPPKISVRPWGGGLRRSCRTISPDPENWRGPQRPLSSMAPVRCRGKPTCFIRGSFPSFDRQHFHPLGSWVVFKYRGSPTFVFRVYAGNPHMFGGSVLGIEDNVGRFQV